MQYEHEIYARLIRLLSINNRKKQIGLAEDGVLDEIGPSKLFQMVPHKSAEWPLPMSQYK